MMMDASSAMPYGTCRGSSSSRITGLTKSTLAMHELLDGGDLERVAERDTALGAVDGPAVRLAGHVQELAAEPPVGGVAHPRLAVWVVGLHVGLLVRVAQHLAQLGVVLRARVRRAGRVREVDAEQRDAALGEHGVGDHPGRGADVAAAVQARQAVGLV